MKRYTVIKYVKEGFFHVCHDETGTEVRVDLLVDGGLGDKNPEEMVGKTYEADYDYPYISIAMRVMEVEQP